MGSKAQKQFVSALNVLLKKQGHGSQARLARALNIDSGYLNNILKGRSPGSQEKKENIAEYFGLQYESMLTLGRQLLSDHDQYPDEETWQSPDNQVALLKDKNMMLIAKWINQQDEPSEYWVLLKMFLRREESEFKEWLKKRSNVKSVK